MGFKISGNIFGKSANFTTKKMPFYALRVDTINYAHRLADKMFMFFGQNKSEIQSGLAISTVNA